MSYQINKAEYICSAVYLDQYPDNDLPEFLLAGRSNVGKSSFINTLTNNKIAKVSSTPGKTQTLNFFNINDELRLVDVPGYGYAKVSNKQIEQFGEMFENYVLNRDTLKAVVLLVDYRHKPTEDDITMYEYVKYYDLPVIIIATKEDKLKRNELKKNKQRIINTLDLDPNDIIIPFSSLKRRGMQEVWNALLKYC